MKKIYVAPVTEIISFSTEDVITSSVPETPGIDMMALGE